MRFHLVPAAVVLALVGQSSAVAQEKPVPTPPAAADKSPAAPAKPEASAPPAAAAPEKKPAATGEKWRKELAADVVVVKDGKLSIDRYDIVKVDNESGRTTLLVALKAMCPGDAGVSRDNFVAYAITAYMAFLTGVAEGGEYSTETVDAPSGKIDVDVSITMNRDGFLVEGKNNKTGEKFNETTRWDELFATKN